MNMREKFIEIYKKHILRFGAEELLEFLINSDFFTAPASSKYHLAIPGGLCQHSVNVYEQLRDQFLHYIEKGYGFTTLTLEQEQTIAICGLLHDICKVNYYTPVKKSRKTGKMLPNGKPEWEDYMGYDVEDKLPYGHGEKSVYIISGFMKLTREEAMDDFSQDYDPGLFEDVDATVFRHRYILNLNDITLMAQTKAALESIEGIAKVNAHLDIANAFISVRNVVSVVSLIIVTILAVVSVFIMANTIKLATFGRREEIGIMKMVGATNAFIRLPFIIEGLILGLVGAIVAFFIEWGIYGLVSEKVMGGIVGALVEVIPFQTLMIPVLVIFLGVGVVVGTFGSVIAIRNYLKV